MSRFFGRRARLLVQQNPVMNLGGPDPFIGPRRPDPPSNILQLPGSPALGNTFTVMTTPLRIQFKIEKNLYTPPNTADISVTNLSEHTRRALQQFGAIVILEAGYQDQVFFSDEDHENHLPTLFKGTARTIDHVRQGKEWITRIQCGDGELAYRYSQASLSVAPGTSYADVAGKLAQTLQPAGVDVSQFMRQLLDGKFTFPREQFVSGYAVSGNALQELGKLLAPNGWAISIQDGQLQVVHGDGSTGEPAILISEGSGMLGSPEHCTPDKNGLQSMLKVKSLLLPTLGPGDPFVIKARDNSGNYTAQKVKHTGDSHATGDDSWMTEIESYPLGAAPVAEAG